MNGELSNSNLQCEGPHKKDNEDEVGEESSDVNHLKFGFIDIKG